MRILLSHETVGAEPELMFQFLVVLREDAQFFRASYPGFDQWVRDKVVPGVLSGERTAVVETRAGEVSGLLIVKNSPEEKKICTLRVRPHYESKGLGIRLFELAFDLLGTDKPLLSVSEGAKPKFVRLFSHFGFSPEAEYAGLYLPSVREYSYNGVLESERGWAGQSRRTYCRCIANFEMATFCDRKIPRQPPPVAMA